MGLLVYKYSMRDGMIGRKILTLKRDSSGCHLKDYFKNQDFYIIIYQ
jgi:hypothetical protein